MKFRFHDSLNLRIRLNYKLNKNLEILIINNNN